MNICVKARTSPHGIHFSQTTGVSQTVGASRRKEAGSNLPANGWAQSGIVVQASNSYCAGA